MPEPDLELGTPHSATPPFYHYHWAGTQWFVLIFGWMLDIHKCGPDYSLSGCTSTWKCVGYPQASFQLFPPITAYTKVKAFPSWMHLQISCVGFETHNKVLSSTVSCPWFLIIWRTTKKLFFKCNQKNCK